MGASNRGFLTVFLGVVAVFLILGVGVAWSIHSAGMVEIDIREGGPGGTEITGLRIPAALGHLALSFVPMHAFDFCEDEEFQQWGPLMVEACRQLDQCPDFVLVEVISRDEHVCVRKQGKAFVVDVESYDERVHISIPIGIARAFAKKVERAIEAHS